MYASEELLHKIIDEAVINITKRVANITLKRSDGLQPDGSEYSTLRITTTGAYCMTFVYRAPPSVFQSIADTMKRKSCTDEADMAEYVKEYFNILCGRIVSGINRETGASVRCGLPEYRREEAPGRGDGAVGIQYECVDVGGAVYAEGERLPVRLEAVLHTNDFFGGA